jgi:hypothetical protein
LKTGLNRSITTAKIGLFTGAGASVPLDLPDTKGFVNVARRRLQEKGSGLTAWLEAVISGVGESDVELMLDAIEGWLTDLERTLKVPALNHQPNLANNIHPVEQMYQDLVRELREGVVDTYGRVDGLRSHALYRPLFTR